MIHLLDVSRNYGSKTAVANLNLEVPQGELFAFLGPNGAGKTTTIKMLVGLLRPSSGTVRVGSHDLTRNTREAVRMIGYVPDQPFLYDKLSGREFLQFVAEMRGMERAEAEAAIGRQSEQFGLQRFLDDLAETYSHGMRQRTVFAAALLHDPPLLVIDEPMVGLDPKSVRLVKDLLRARTGEGKTVFMSTHTLALAEEIADRIGIVDHGRVSFLGTLAELREQPSARQKTLEQLFLEMTAEGNGHTAAGPLAQPTPSAADGDES